jgi:hypothetical protein
VLADIVAAAFGGVDFEGAAQPVKTAAASKSDTANKVVFINSILEPTFCGLKPRLQSGIFRSNKKSSRNNFSFRLGGRAALPRKLVFRYCYIRFEIS